MDEVQDLCRMIMEVLDQVMHQGQDLDLFDKDFLDDDMYSQLLDAWTEQKNLFEEFFSRSLEGATDETLVRIRGAGLIGAQGAAKRGWIGRIWEKLKSGAGKLGWLRKLLKIIKTVLGSLKDVFGLGGLGPWADGVGEIVDLLEEAVKEDK
jgi:hypothetical protein